MHVELLKCVTSDGVRLDGALTTAIGGTTGHKNRCDALIALHGAGSNFYSSALFEEVARRAAEQGIATLRVNTRGAGALSLQTGPDGARRQGAAYEKVSECVHDIAAWIDLLQKRGYSRIGLIGHSLGAVKAIYSQNFDRELSPTETLNRAATCLVALSPPRLSYSTFRASRFSSQHFDAVTLAKDKVAAGKPQELLEVKFPLPMLISAAGYLDKYGPAEVYNYLQHAPKVQVPTLYTFGSSELGMGWPAFDGAPEAIAALGNSGGPREVRIVEGADHFYRGVEEDAAEVATAWLAADA